MNAMTSHNEAQKTNDEIINAFRNVYVEIEEVMERSVLNKYEMFLQGVLTLKDTQHAKDKADWLRNEIEKLEGMKVKEFHLCSIDVIDGKEVISCPAYCHGVEHNRALTSIITRYKEELKVLEGNV